MAARHPGCPRSWSHQRQDSEEFDAGDGEEGPGGEGDGGEGIDLDLLERQHEVEREVDDESDDEPGVAEEAQAGVGAGDVREEDVVTLDARQDALGVAGHGGQQHAQGREAAGGEGSW